MKLEAGCVGCSVTLQPATTPPVPANDEAGHATAHTEQEDDYGDSNDGSEGPAANVKDVVRSGGMTIEAIIRGEGMARCPLRHGAR